MTPGRSRGAAEARYRDTRLATMKKVEDMAGIIRGIGTAIGGFGPNPTDGSHYDAPV